MPTIASTLLALRQRIASNFGDLITATASGGGTTGLTATGDIDSYPAGSLVGAEISTTSGTGAAQTRHVTAHTKTGGTVTLTVPTWSTVDATTVYEIHKLNGRGFTKKQYDDAINAAIDAMADKYFTDVSNMAMGCQLAGATGGLARKEYPLPSGFNFLWGVDLLNSAPLAHNRCGYLQTARALGDAAARTRVGQGFRLLQSEPALIAYISVFMAKVGSPTDNLTIVVETNTSGLPSTTAVTDGTSDAVDGSTLDTRMRNQVFAFTPPLLLDGSTTYHFTLRRSGATDASNYYTLGEDDENHYGDGAMSLYGGAAWTAVSGSDLLFAVFPQADWLKLTPSNWEYLPQSTADQLLIRKLGAYDGTPIRLRGGAAIARPTAETTSVALDPGFIEAYAMAFLRRSQVGMTNVPDASGQAGQILSAALALPQGPQRPYPSGTVKIW